MKFFTIKLKKQQRYAFGKFSSEIVVCNKGKVLEILGSVSSQKVTQNSVVKLNFKKLNFWVAHGAFISKDVFPYLSLYLTFSHDKITKV